MPPTRLLLCSFALALAASASARTIYVAPAGLNANDGSARAPVRTITYAASIARPGDEVRVRAGVYYEPVYIAVKGTAARPITFAPQRGEHVVIDGSGTPAGTDLVTLDRVTNVGFSGFEVRYSKNIGISIWGSSHVRVTGNDVHTSIRNAICASFSRRGVSSDISIEGNTVHENVLENTRQTIANGGWASGITLAMTTGARVAGNRVWENYGEGIGVGLTNQAVIEQNVVFDNFSANIYLDNARFVKIDRNLVYNTGLERVFRFGQPAVGVGLANERWSTSNPISNITMTNNIVINTRAGLLYGSYERGGGLKNCVVANNTFFKATTALLSIDRDAHANSTVENNIFYQSGSGAGAQVAGRGIAYRNNNWFGAAAGAAAGAGDVDADPRLVHPGGLRAVDYRLQPGSPVAGMGVPNAAAPADFFGTRRSGAYDIGACQMSGGATPRLSSRSRGGLDDDTSKALSAGGAR